MATSLQAGLPTNTHVLPSPNRTLSEKKFLRTTEGISWPTRTKIWRKPASLEIDPVSFFADTPPTTSQDQSRSYSSSPSSELTNIHLNTFIAATSSPMLIPPLDLNEGQPAAPPRTPSASSEFSDESPLPTAQCTSATKIKLNSRNSFMPINSLCIALNSNQRI